MVVKVDATGTALITTVAGASVNYTGITVGTGVDRALVVTVACAAAVTAPNAHWDTAGANQAMTLITAVETQTNVTTFMFGLRNPVAGAKTLNVAWTTSAKSNIEAISFTDVDQTSDARAFINANFVKDAATVSSILMGLVSPADSIAVASYGTSATFSSLTGTNLFTDTTNTGCEGAASRSNGAGVNINFTGADTSTAGNKVMVGFVVAPVITVSPPPLSDPVRPKIAGAIAIAIMASGLFSGPLPPKEDVAKVDRWYTSWEGPVWPKRGLAAHEQPFLAFTVPAREDIPRQEWIAPWQGPVRVRPALGIQHQPASAFLPLVPTAATIQDWPDFAKAKPRAIEVQPLPFGPFPIAATPPTGWNQPWSNPTLRKTAPVPDQPFMPPQIAPVVSTAIVAGEDGSFGPIFKYRLIYKAKTEPIVFTAATTPTGWNDPLEVPVRNWQRSTAYTAPFLALGVPPAQVWFPPNVTPDIVPTRAKPTVDFKPWTFLEPPPQVWYPSDRWPDTAPAAKRVVQNPDWSYGTFVTPTATPTYTQWTQWPDFAPAAKRTVDFRPWSFVEPPPQVFFPYAPWPDFAPKAKPLVDIRPWTFVPPPRQVFFPYGPWDDFARRKPQPLDTQPLDWSGFTPVPPVSTAVVASEDGSSGPTFKWRLIYRVKTEPVFVPPVIVPTMAWVRWPDFAPKARPSTDPQSFAFVPLVPTATVIGDWPDFATRKPQPLDIQPQAFVFTSAPAPSTYATVVYDWPDFASRKPQLIDTQPLIWSNFTPAAFYATVIHSWPDFARRKPQLSDTQFLSWSAFTPAPAAAFFLVPERWPDFARRKPQPIDTQPLAEPINFTAATVINTWAQWPDFAPRKKSAADFIPWTFIPIPRQVFFPYAPWDDFTRRKPQPLDTQPLAISFNVEPTLVTKWFEALSTPPGPKRGLGAYLQSSYTNDTIAAAIQLFARTPWYAPLSEPVRIKPGLRAWLQKFLERDPFGASVYLASLNATEQGDFLTAVLSQFNTPLLAYVDIVQNDPRHRGNLGVIENVAQSSIIASIAEPQTVPATGQPVSTVAGARVAIIIQGAGP